MRRYADELAARLDDPKIEDKYRLARHRKIERARKLGDRDPYRAAGKATGWAFKRLFK